MVVVYLLSAWAGDFDTRDDYGLGAAFWSFMFALVCVLQCQYIVNKLICFTLPMLRTIPESSL